MNNNVVLTQYIVNYEDAQRQYKSSDTISEKAINGLKRLVRSSVSRGSRVILITNDKNLNINIPGLEIVVEEVPNEVTTCSLYFIRWIITFRYLMTHSNFDKIALVDATDVLMIKSPFFDMDENVIYVGDEQSDLSTYIVKYEKTNVEIKTFVQRYEYLQLLNPGVVIGQYQVIIEFLGIMCSYIYNDALHDKKFGNLEMALFNYIIYNFFSGRAIHGRQVSTLFHHEAENTISWFMHK
ncbi:hypothetical protein H9L19_08125 [Weissella diestrammenae]|uniref:Uncharacterized protein n=1 Tax=Weissella diestrammenae TaxID=1162633 RepID=A0A7G9T5E0_9LACO|nr:hypothetical protein [Weissella diestrammenae]MCM0583173.1 hypothetical protein [Weissella diestrammenae]QNN75315.1 hypothetical protein H9L19_08125 [Weissella diestrammenae]